ncbi:MAG: hypothetical protein J5590_06560 [Clostridia bacterium]|nr:hypothetical protein [Clostridia bacterium]
MYWYKVKNMLIILFTLLNVFLLSMIIISNIRADKREKELSETLLTVLEKNEISVDKEVLNGERTKLHVFKIENVVEDSFEFADKITGASTKKELDEAGNICYTAGNKKVYINSGRFMMADSAVPETTQTEEDIAAAKEFFEEIGVDLSGCDSEIKGDRIVFTYKINSVPVFEKQLYVKMYGGVMSECGGHLIKILNEEENENKELYVREALLKFLRDPEREKTPFEVKGVNTGYWVILGNDSVSFKYTDAIPAYEVKTDKGSFYYYN